MNATVKRIVELLFEDLEMTEEVCAIRDELMNNCQERFDDLIASGMKEDEATGAVVESLKGMEDVLAEYPRKVQQRNEAETQMVTFHPEQVDTVNVSLSSADVYVDASDDGMIHVEYEHEFCEGIRVRLDGKTLVIDEEPAVSMKKRKSAHVHVQSDVKINSLADIGKLLKSLRINVGVNCDMIHILLPRCARPEININTTSGDIDVRNTVPARMKLSSTSGDLNVILDEEQNVQEVKLNTVSGDIEAAMGCISCSASTMSGDVSLEGKSEQLWVSSVSGDVCVEADATRLEFKTVSGDARVTCTSRDVKFVQGNTVSGDMELRMPKDVAVILQTKTTSGHVENRASGQGCCTAEVNLKSISGDMTIR